MGLNGYLNFSSKDGYIIFFLIKALWLKIFLRSSVKRAKIEINQQLHQTALKDRDRTDFAETPGNLWSVAKTCGPLNHSFFSR